MTTVGSLAYQIVANTSSFTAGTTATKAELRTLKSAFLDSLTPVEKYSAGIAELERLAAAFPAKAGPLRRTIAAMREEIAHEQWRNSPLGHALDRIGIVIDPVSAGLQGLRIASDLARAGFAQLQQLVGAVATEMERLDHIAKRSGNLGVSEGALTGLQRAAADISGVDAAQFDAAFTAFTQRIGQGATEGTGKAVKAFERLGLSLTDLVQMTPDQAFLRTAKAVAEVKNPTERLQLAFQLLGKSGGDLATMLAAGDVEIQKLMDDQNRLSQTEFINFEEIEAANDELGRLQGLLTGMLSVLTSELSHVIKEIAGDLVTGFGTATEDGAKFRDVAQEIALAMANVADRIAAVTRFASKLNSVLPDREKLKPFMFLLNPLGTIGGEIAERGLQGEFDDDVAGKTFVQRLNESRAKTAAGSGPGTAPGTVADVARAAEEKLDKDRLAAVAKLEEQLQTEVETFGLAGKAAEIYRLQLQGVGEAQLIQVRALQEKLVALEATRKATEATSRAEQKAAEKSAQALSDNAEKGKRLSESLLTPAEKLRKEYTDLQQLFLKTGTGLTVDDQVRALESLRDKAKSLSGSEVQPQTVGAIHAGSIEALRAQFNQPRTGEEKTLAEAKKQTTQQKQTNELLKELNDQLAALEPFGVVF